MVDPSATRMPPVMVRGSAVRRLPAVSRYSLRGKPPVLAAAARALELEYADRAGHSARHRDRAALWMGPDEQLLLAPIAEAAEVQQLLANALSGLPHSLVDISHRQVALEISGPYAEALLCAGCPLDLGIEAFPVGMATRTLLGKATIVLWRTGPQTFHIEVWRSFTEYLTRFLAEAARELAG